MDCHPASRALGSCGFVPSSLRPFHSRPFHQPRPTSPAMHVSGCQYHSLRGGPPSCAVLAVCAVPCVCTCCGRVMSEPLAGVADRVMLGLIPTSEGSWAAAVRTLKPEVCALCAPAPSSPRTPVGAVPSLLSPARTLQSPLLHVCHNPAPGLLCACGYPLLLRHRR
jgi:hypothetical protein